MANCLWNDFEGHRKLHLANWKLVCKKKEFGGLGIPDLANVNLCLLGSWVSRYSRDDGKLWKQMVDSKYNTDRPNIFCSEKMGVSQFWKGMMWAAESVKFGYRWKIGSGNKVRFWEDTWFGTSPLAVQFFDIYILCNEQGKTVQSVWDGTSLKLTFRRNFSPRLMQLWYELREVAASISFSTDADALVWQYESKGVYSTSSLYAIINFGGVTPVFIPAVWQICVPPRLHIFLWLLAQNKLMTRDNLKKGT